MEFSPELTFVQLQDPRGRVEILLEESSGALFSGNPASKGLTSSLSELAFGCVALTENQDIMKIHFYNTDFVLLTRVCTLVTTGLSQRGSMASVSRNSSGQTRESLGKRLSTATDSGFGELSSCFSETSMPSLNTCSDLGSGILVPKTGSENLGTSVEENASPHRTLAIRNSASFMTLPAVQNMPERKNMSDPGLCSRRTSQARKGGRLAVTIALRCVNTGSSRYEILSHMTDLELCLVRFQTYVRRHFNLAGPIRKLVKEASVKLGEDLRAVHHPSLFPARNFVSVSQGNKMFMQSLKRLEKLLDTKGTKFFLSTLCSAVFLHCQDWMPQLSPADLSNNRKYCRILLCGCNPDLLEDLRLFLRLLLNPAMRTSSAKSKVAKRCQTCPLGGEPRRRGVLKRRRSFPPFDDAKISWSANNPASRTREDLPFVKNLEKVLPINQDLFDEERIRLLVQTKEGRTWQSYFKDAISLESEATELSHRAKMITWVVGDLRSHDVIMLSASARHPGSREKLNLSRSSAMLSPLIGSAIEETSRVFSLTGSARMASHHLNNCLLRLCDLSRVLVECLVPEPRWEIHELAPNLGVHRADLPLLLGVASAYLPGIDEQFQLDFR